MSAALEGVRCQRHAPAALYPREIPGTHFTGGWVGSRAGLEGRKISSSPGFDPRTVQPIASRYADYATWPTLPQYRRENLAKANLVPLEKNSNARL